MNSSHHQAVDRVAPSLRVTARATDGVIEAVESADNGRFLVGVQWHPEDDVEGALFEGFADAVVGR